MKHHKGMRDGILLENSNDRYNELYTKNIYIYTYNMSDEKAEFEMPFDTEESERAIVSTKVKIKR